MNNINFIISKNVIPEWSEQLFKKNNIIVIDNVCQSDIDNLSILFNINSLNSFSECII